MTRPHPRALADFTDLVESLDGTVEIDQHWYTTWAAPKVTVRVNGRTASTVRPTYRQCFERLTDWLRDNAGG